MALLGNVAINRQKKSPRIEKSSNTVENFINITKKTYKILHGITKGYTSFTNSWRTFIKFGLILGHKESLSDFSI